MYIEHKESSDKDMHKSSWMIPPRPNVPKEIEKAD